MAVITITIQVDVPDGARVSVGGAPATSTPAPTPISAPGASTAPSSQAYVPSQGVRELWPAGECPKHHKPWKDGTYGQFCTAKDDSGPKGYCPLKPGDLFNGKVAA